MVHGNYNHYLIIHSFIHSFRLLAKKGIEITKDMIFKTGAFKITVDNNDTIIKSNENSNKYLNNINNNSLFKETGLD